jgi:hypothetical protein
MQGITMKTIAIKTIASCSQFFFTFLAEVKANFTALSNVPAIK